MVGMRYTYVSWPQRAATLNDCQLKKSGLQSLAKVFYVQVLLLFFRWQFHSATILPRPARKAVWLVRTDPFTFGPMWWNCIASYVMCPQGIRTSWFVTQPVVTLWRMPSEATEARFLQEYVPWIQSVDCFCFRRLSRRTINMLLYLSSSIKTSNQSLYEHQPCKDGILNFNYKQRPARVPRCQERVQISELRRWQLEIVETIQKTMKSWWIPCRFHPRRISCGLNPRKLPCWGWSHLYFWSARDLETSDLNAGSWTHEIDWNFIKLVVKLCKTWNNNNKISTMFALEEYAYRCWSWLWCTTRACTAALSTFGVLAPKKREEQSVATNPKKQK